MFLSNASSTRPRLSRWCGNEGSSTRGLLLFGPYLKNVIVTQSQFWSCVPLCQLKWTFSFALTIINCNSHYFYVLASRNSNKHLFHRHRGIRMAFTVNKSRTTFITGEILSFALRIGRTPFSPTKFYCSHCRLIERRFSLAKFHRSRSALLTLLKTYFFSLIPMK